MQGVWRQDFTYKSPLQAWKICISFIIQDQESCFLCVKLSRRIMLTTASPSSRGALVELLPTDFPFSRLSAAAEVLSAATRVLSITV
jgi:hypothetical protein